MYALWHQALLIGIKSGELKQPGQDTTRAYLSVTPRFPGLLFKAARIGALGLTWRYHVGSLSRSLHFQENVYHLMSGWLV